MLPNKIENVQINQILLDKQSKCLTMHCKSTIENFQQQQNKIAAKGVLVALSQQSQ